MKLTRREREIAGLVAEGLTNRAIAERLFLSERTVEGHVEHALGKLGFDSRAQLAAWVAGTAGELENDVALPVQLTRFVGREQEIAEVRGLLARHRLVTLTGTGGAGKTRLALAVAENSPRFARVRWAPLADVADSERVTAEVAVAAGAAAADEAALLARLSEAPTLLVLDNCEHVVAAAARLVKRLVELSRVTVLATSREPLAVEGEAVHAVAPLSLADAVELFHERAQPAAAADAAEAALVCERVDRLPLAVELAAARTRVMSVKALAESLAMSTAVLSGGPREAPARQRSVEASIRWSYDQLDADRRWVFGELGVFGGHFGLDWATALTGAELPVVLDLVDRSLLERDADRYRMLFPVREFARARLCEAGAEAAVEERHDRLAAEIIRSCEGAALERDWPQTKRLWAARDLAWPALERLRERDPETFVEVAPIFGLVAALFGHRLAGHRLTDEAARLARPEHPDFARAQLIAGSQLVMAGQLDAAAPLLETALEASQEQPRVRLRSLYFLSVSAALRGDHGRAGRIRREIEAEAAGEPATARAVLLNNDAMERWNAGDFAGGEALAREAIELFTGGEFAWPTMSETLARNLEGLGRHAEALEVMREAARMVLDEGVVGQTIWTLWAMARELTALGEEERAAVLLGAMRALEKVHEYARLPAEAQSPLVVELMERWPEAVEQGRGLGWQEALAFAIDS